MSPFAFPNPLGVLYNPQERIFYSTAPKSLLSLYPFYRSTSALRATEVLKVLCSVPAHPLCRTPGLSVPTLAAVLTLQLVHPSGLGAMALQGADAQCLWEW